MVNEAELTIKAITDNIGLARVTVATFASQLDFTISELEELKVAVSEAVSNAIIHAYPEKPGKIKIKVRILRKQLEIIIKDQGRGIKDLESACQPSYTTTDRMGLGLTFIDSFMDKFNISSTPGEGTSLEMVKVPVQASNKEQ